MNAPFGSPFNFTQMHFKTTSFHNPRSWLLSTIIYRPLHTVNDLISEEFDIVYMVNRKFKVNKHTVAI